METFEVDTKCCWTSHSFRAGEKGMKCLTCQKVAQTHALNERRSEGKKLCYCDNPNFVEAIASSFTPTTRLGNNRNQSRQTPRQVTRIPDSQRTPFEAGVKCPYTMHTFTSGERGMKCQNPNCPRVITISAWNEKKRCFCGSTNVVEAIATTSNPTNLTTNRQVMRIPIDWRDTTPANTSTSSTNPVNLGNTNTHIGQFSTSNQANINTNIPNNTNNPSTNSSNLSFKLLKFVGVGAFLLFVTYTTPLKNLINPLFWQSHPSKTTEVPSTETSNISSSPSPTPNIANDDLVNKADNADISPEKVVKQYYDNINSDNYQAAWDSLPVEMQNDTSLHPNGYISFTDWWGKTVEKIDIQKIDLVSQTTQEAVVKIYVNYFMKSGNRKAYSLRYFLGKNNNNVWIINKIKLADEDNSIPSPKTSPDEFVREHYSLINQRQYKTTWQRLTSSFQNQADSYSEYVNWWESVSRINIGQITVIEQRDDSAIVNANLSFVMKRGDVVNDDKSRIYLVWNNNQNTWQVDNKEKP